MTAKKPRVQSRQAKRLILLIKQLLVEPRFGGNQRAVATALNIDVTLPSKFARDPSRDVDCGVIERVLEHFEPTLGMRLDPAFFLPAFFLEGSITSPDYRDYIRTKALTPRRTGSTELAKEIANLRAALEALLPLSLEGVEPMTAYKLGALTSAAEHVLQAWRGDDGPRTR